VVLLQYTGGRPDSLVQFLTFSELHFAADTFCCLLLPSSTVLLLREYLLAYGEGARFRLFNFENHQLRDSRSALPEH